MGCIIHYGNNREKTIRMFQDKRVAWVVNRLSAYTVEYLKRIRNELYS